MRWNNGCDLGTKSKCLNISMHRRWVYVSPYSKKSSCLTQPCHGGCLKVPFGNECNVSCEPSCSWKLVFLHLCLARSFWVDINGRTISCMYDRLLGKKGPNFPPTPVPLLSSELWPCLRISEHWAVEAEPLHQTMALSCPSRFCCWVSSTLKY